MRFSPRNPLNVWSHDFTTASHLWTAVALDVAAVVLIIVALVTVV